MIISKCFLPTNASQPSDQNECCFMITATVASVAATYNSDLYCVFYHSDDFISRILMDRQQDNVSFKDPDDSNSFLREKISFPRTNSAYFCWCIRWPFGPRKEIPTTPSPYNILGKCFGHPTSWASCLWIQSRCPSRSSYGHHGWSELVL